MSVISAKTKRKRVRDLFINFLTTNIIFFRVENSSVSLNEFIKIILLMYNDILKVKYIRYRTI